MTTTTTQGRDWLSMNPAHFDASLLPMRQRKAADAGLFSVADILPSAPETSAKTAPELDGQGDLFGTEEP